MEQPFSFGWWMGCDGSPTTTAELSSSNSLNIPNLAPKESLPTPIPEGSSWLRKSEHSKFLSLQIFQLNTPQKKHLVSPCTTEIGFAGESKEKIN